jgi:hypothetical protein
LVYEFGGHPALGYTLSKSFAEQHGITGGQFPLPDDFPPWADLTSAMCYKCFIERYGKEPEEKVLGM